jgi:hypothetical protein
MVHLQPYHGYSPVCCDSHDFERTLFGPLKMVDPPLCPGIEQRHCLPRLGIFPVDVRPLAGIAVRARQRQIGHICQSAPGSWHNMVDLEATNLELRGQLTVEFISIDGILCLRRKAAPAMGSLRFADIQTRPKEVLDWTSLT